MSLIQTQIQKNCGSGWVDWGETLIACYPLHNEEPVGDCFDVITDYDYVMKFGTGFDLRLKLEIKDGKIPLWMIIHNKDLYLNFDCRNVSNSGILKYCDRLRIIRYDDEFVSDFDDMGVKDSVEVNQIFVLIDQIQLILNQMCPDLKPVLDQIKPFGLTVTDMKDLVDLYNVIESTKIREFCEQLYGVSMKVIENQVFKDE